MSKNAASTTQSTFQASPDIRDRSIKKHYCLGKYFPKLQIRVNRGVVALALPIVPSESALLALILQIVKSGWGRNPNHLCSARGSTERKLGAGKEPNTASLKWAVGDRFIKWLGKTELAKIKNQGGQV
jgi:hypothetical protein